jgi:ribosomal subunit interface protein
MRVSIKTRNIECDEELRAYVNRRVAFALSRFADAVQSVEVLLEDVGTTDQRCWFQVHVRRGGDPIECETTHSDLLAAIDLTSGRAGRTVARRLDLKLAPRASR